MTLIDVLSLVQSSEASHLTAKPSGAPPPGAFEAVFSAMIEIAGEPLAADAAMDSQTVQPGEPVAGWLQLLEQLGAGQETLEQVAQSDDPAEEAAGILAALGGEAAPALSLDLALLGGTRGGRFWTFAGTSAPPGEGAPAASAKPGPSTGELRVLPGRDAGDSTGQPAKARELRVPSAAQSGQTQATADIPPTPKAKAGSAGGQEPARAPQSIPAAAKAPTQAAEASLASERAPQESARPSPGSAGLANAGMGERPESRQGPVQAVQLAASSAQEESPEPKPTQAQPPVLQSPEPKPTQAQAPVLQSPAPKPTQAQAPVLQSPEPKPTQAQAPVLQSPDPKPAQAQAPVLRATASVQSVNSPAAAAKADGQAVNAQGVSAGVAPQRAEAQVSSATMRPEAPAETPAAGAAKTAAPSLGSNPAQDGAAESAPVLMPETRAALERMQRAFAHPAAEEPTLKDGPVEGSQRRAVPPEAVRPSPEASAAPAPAQAQATARTDAPVTPAAAPASRWIPIEAVPETLIRQVRAASRNGDSRVTLRLSPPSLGDVLVDISRSEGVVHVRVAAGQATTREWMETHLPQLRQSLANEGIHLGSLDVAADNSGSSSQGFGRSLSGQDARGGASQPGGSAPPHSAEPALRGSKRTHAGALDLSV